MKRHSSEPAGAAAGRSEGLALYLPELLLDGLRVRAREAWPCECCGLLAARAADVPGSAESSRAPGAAMTGRRVVRAVEVENPCLEPGRYRIPAAVLRRVEAELEAESLEVIGVYHSHPDGTSRPSATDLEAAWPWYSYVIVPIPGGGRADRLRTGGPAAVRSWRLRDDRGGFVEERVGVEREGVA